MKTSTLKSILIMLGLFFTTLAYSQNEANSGNIKIFKQPQNPEIGIELIQSRILSNQNAVELIETKSKNEPIMEMVHQHYTASYQGIEIALSSFASHMKNGKITSITGPEIDLTLLKTKPDISKIQAFENALSHIDAFKYLWEEPDHHHLNEDYQKPEGKLVILPSLPGLSNEAKLAYQFEIIATDPLYIADVFVDAHTGEVIFENSKLCNVDVSANGNSTYNGQVNFTAETYNSEYKLSNTSSTLGGLETLKFNQSGTNIYLSPITSKNTTFNDINAVQAHWGAEQTLSYFQTNHNHNSYDGNGSRLTIVADAYGNGYTNNAFWYQNKAWFGTGDGQNYNSFSALDVVGHEVAHGVTQYSAGLIYSYESGALNESFSDIFGEEVQMHATGNRDWLVGDEVIPGVNNGLRSFSNPNQYNMPDTYYGQYYQTGSFDNGGVHYNSSVQNFWFYLLSNGGVGTNDFNENYSVDAISPEKAAKIAFRNLTVYLPPTSGFFDARNGSILAARDLYGIGSQEEISVTNAWHAVGVGNAYGDNSGPTCATGPVQLVLNLDDHPELIAWNVVPTTSSNFVAFSALGTYSSNQAYTTVTTNIPATSNGNYKFTIYDLSRDGLSNQGGSYHLISNGDTLASGSVFDLSDAAEFCINFSVGPPADLDRPTIPLLAQATSITSNSADLSWTPSSDASGIQHYTLFYNDTYANIPGTSFNLTGLIPNTN